jgi:hypothetical protein
MALRHHRPWAPLPLDRALAAQLGPHAAWLLDQTRVLAIRVEPDAVSTPALSLVQAIWEHLPAQAHATLRARIRTTAPPCALDRATVQLAAKKLASGIEPQPGPVELPVLVLDPWLALARAKTRASVFDPGVSRVTDPRELDQWLPPEPAALPRALRDRPLVAALLDPEGRLLMAARNTSGSNRTLHAELNLVHAWWMATARPLPAGSRLLATLRPCRMCAALIARAATPPLEVLYLHHDPGPLAQHTALDDLGWQRLIA